MKTRIITWIIILIILAIPFFYMKWTANQARLYQIEYGQILRKEIGFNHGSPYVMTGNDKTEVFTIYPDETSILYSAGLRNGDIIVSDSITSFYKLLYHSKGQQITVDVITGGDGLPLKDREIRTIKFKVPE